MGEMARDFFTDNPALSGPLLALVLFTLIFVIAGLRAWRADGAYVARIASLPLEEDLARDTRTAESMTASSMTASSMTEEHHG